MEGGREKEGDGGREMEKGREKGGSEKRGREGGRREGGRMEGGREIVITFCSPSQELSHRTWL